MRRLNGGVPRRHYVEIDFAGSALNHELEPRGYLCAKIELTGTAPSPRLEWWGRT